MYHHEYLLKNKKEVKRIIKINKHNLTIKNVKSTFWYFYMRMSDFYL